MAGMNDRKAASSSWAMTPASARTIGLAIALTMVATLTVGAAGAAEYVIAKESGSRVVFTSKAPMETIEGKTEHVSGRLDVDLAQLTGALDLVVEVDLATFDTGLGLRNTHMRDNHLETDKFPVATFTAREVVAAMPDTLSPGGTAQVRLIGSMDLHGVQRDVDTEGSVTLEQDGTLLLETTFTVSLADHGIKRPSFLVMKLADEQKVRLALRATQAGD